ncbi:uncharacterized protein LOC120354418 [Nilaparvata lugens]|uniref:uncharacterized protein LOC120354418 n=1 Tax=Nilaparvata lugens TaxID=108931 RepID=UPI00193D4515|nr:uncharacterized protein LOC120354418 [Nilaparvata lugens]
MNSLIQGQITLIECLRRLLHQNDTLFNRVLNYSLQVDEGLMEEELEVITNEWMNADIGAAEEVVLMEEAAAVPPVALPAAAVPPAAVLAAAFPPAAIPPPPADRVHPMQRRPRGRGRRGQNEPRGAREQRRALETHPGGFSHCCICYDLQATYASIPCGHICMCAAKWTAQHGRVEMPSM